MASKKLYAPDKEVKRPSEGLFSAVLSGMASVFNQAVKTPRKRYVKPKMKTSNDPENSAESLSDNNLNTSMEDDGELSQIHDESLANDATSTELTQEIVDGKTSSINEVTTTSSQEVLNVADKIENVTISDDPFEVSNNCQTDLITKSLEVPAAVEMKNQLEPEVQEKVHRRHSPKKKSRKKMKKDEEKLSDNEDTLDPIKIESDPTSENVQTKPRIVLTFRSEKIGPRSTNVKIVTDLEKAAEKSGSNSRRSLRNNKLSVKTSPESADSEQTEEGARGNSESDDSLKTPTKKNKRSNVSSMSDSNSDDSPSSNKDGVKKSDRHRSRENCDGILANAVARKEKSINETLTAGTTRLSRRIKPTAKVLANRELRIGFETQNNARLAVFTEMNAPTEECKTSPRSKLKKSPEKGKISIMSTSKSQKPIKNDKEVVDTYAFTEEFIEPLPQKKNIDDKLTTDEINRCILGMDDDGGDKSVKDDGDNIKDDEDVEDDEDDDDLDYDESKIDETNANLSPEEVEVRRVNRLKKRHLKKLGLKEVSERLKKRKVLPEREVVSDDSTMDSTNTEAIVEHLNTRSRSFDCGSIGQPASPETARILETIALFEEEDENTKAKESSDEEYNPYENERIASKKAGKKRKASSSDLEDSLPIVQLSRLSEKNIKAKVRTSRKKSKKGHAEVEFVECGIDEPEMNLSSSESEPEEEEEEPEPVAEDVEVEAELVSACLCTQHTNIYLHPNHVNEVEFCRAVDWVNGRAIGCGRIADTGLPLVRAGIRAPYFLSCHMHRRRLHSHHCCSACGAFCTQGVFYQCSEGHLFHWECGLPFVSLLMPSILADVQNVNKSTSPAIAAATDSSVPTSTPVVNGETPLPAPGFISPPNPSQKPTANDIYNAVPGCPHCGLNKDTLEPINVDSSKVYIEMKTSGDKMLLPNPRFQWVPSRMTFRQSGNEKQIKNDTILDIDELVGEVDQDVAIIPPELLPSLVDGLAILKERLERNGNLESDDNDVSNSTKELIKVVCSKDCSVEKIIAALVDGADPRKSLPEADGGSCLHLAARELNLSAVHLCRTLGCQLNSIDSKRRTPLMVAIISYDNRVKKIEKDCEFTGIGGVSKEPKADKEEREGRMEELKKVCRTELYNIIRYLMKAGSDPTIKGPEGVSALHLSAKNCDVGACALMLEGHVGVSKTLLNQRDTGGWTPLVWAAENNNVHVVRYLLEKGADPMIADTEKNIALHWAAVSGCSRSLEALLNAGCPVDIANVHGDTPLHVSARQDNYNCLVVLIARNAKLTTKNANGEIPLDCVEEESNCYSVLAVNNHLVPLITALSQNEIVVSSDISIGKEPNVVRCVNGADDVTDWSHFTYITKNCYTNDVNIERRISSIEACSCIGRCGQADDDCNCASISVQSWYEPTGKLVPHFDYDDPPMIFECNDMCACNKNICLNRSLTRGPHCVLEVFRCKVPRSKDSPSMGWGVRAGTYIQRGQLVAEYKGEVLGTKEAFAREDHSYLFQLDNKHGLVEENKETYCIDARYYGNVSRFINHSCRPNIVPVRVFTSHRDVSFPRIAFFACRDIKPGEEVSFDYGDNFWAAKSASLKCGCEADNCRYTDREKKEFVEPEAYDAMSDTMRDDDDSNHDDIIDYDDVDVSMVKSEDMSY